MNDQERQELVERRKKEQQEKELTNDIAYQLHLKNKENKQKSMSRAEQNKYVEAAIIFLGTLTPLYAFIFIPYWIFNFLWGADLSKIGLPIGILIPYLHGAILLASLISVYQKKSVLDSFFDYFSN